MLIYFDEPEAKAAAENLRAMPAAARKLLSECIETQGVTRTAISAAARSLENEGFIFVREIGDYPGYEKYELSPSLAGEEAMETLENLNDAVEPT